MVMVAVSESAESSPVKVMPRLDVSVRGVWAETKVDEVVRARRRNWRTEENDGK
jgi:hypothetical protein